MGALTPRILLGLEDRMNIIVEREYARLGATTWWQDVATTRTSTGQREFITWMLNTAMIRDLGKSAGNLKFSDLMSKYTEIENKFAGEGFMLSKAQLTDTDGGGIDLAAEWAGQIGAYMAYWPQKRVAHALMNGHTAALYTGYDGKALFATDHPTNPADTAVGTPFANIFTSTASGAYPGACPIDDGVTVDVALANLGKIFGYIASIKMPNGEDPRGLEPSTIICPPRMYPRVLQLTNAKVIAQAAATGGGGADVEALITGLGYGQPKMAAELAGFESDTTFFVVAKQKQASALGAIVYQEREPFQMASYGPMDDAVLGRMQSFEWQVHGRNAVAAGHPYLIFKCKAT